VRIPVKIFLSGLVISFLGSLPPGHLTLSAAYIAAEQGINDAAIYSTGATIAEMIAVKLALSLLHKTSLKPNIFFILEISTAILLTIITTGCFYLAGQTSASSEINPFSVKHPFLTGFFVSIINPVHIFFWMGWSIFLLDRKILLPISFSYNVFTVAIGIGGILGFIIFIYGGEWLLRSFSNYHHILFVFLGTILLTGAILYIHKLATIPFSVRHKYIFKEKNNISVL
jgi:threonine/homoserine/homoserine lactone efflux protein